MALRVVDENELDRDVDMYLLAGMPFSGVGRLSFDDGSIEYETTYKDGFADGHMKRFFNSGQLAYSIDCRKGLRHGKAVEWYENGQIKSEKRYEYGIEIESVEYSSEGLVTDKFELDKASTNYQLLQKFRAEEKST